MSDSLNVATVELVKTITEYLKGTGEFVKEQAPALCQQIIDYGFWSNLIWMVIYVLLIIASTLSSKYCINKFVNEYERDDYMVVGMTGVLLGVVALVFTFCFFCDGQDLLQIIYAPKLYILKELKHI